MSESFQPLSEFITLQRGFDLPERLRIDGGVPVVASTSIVGYHNEAKVKAPGVTIGRSGSIGGGQYLKDDFWPLNTSLWVKDFKGHDPKYVYYLLRSIDFTRFNVGAGVPTLNRNHLDGVKVRVISNAEEKRVSDFICAYDDLIENNLRRIELLEESARLLYKEWFVHLRFPGHEHVKKGGGVPEGWSIKALTDLAKINEQSLKRGFEGGIEYIDIASVSPNSINDTNWYEFKDAPGRARRILKHQDIIWSCVRPNRRSHAFIWMPHNRLIASTGFAVISAKNISPFYLYQYLTSSKYVGYLTNNAGGAAYPAVTARVFERSEILSPPHSLLVSFDNFSENLFHQIQLLSTHNKKLAEARDLLLPRLMNGDLAV